MIDILHDIANYFVAVVCIFIFGIGLIQVFIYLWQLVVAIFVLVRNPEQDRRLLSTWQCDGLSHPITIIMPAYNESVTIINSIQSMLASDYPNVDMIVVNDGSTDNTLELIHEHFDLISIDYHEELTVKSLPHAKIRNVYVSRKDERLRVIDKDNGGKADAHNVAINLSRAPILCLLDADSILAPDALSKAVSPFIDDPKTIAVGGTIRVANGCTIRNGIVRKIKLSKNKLVLFQVIEYMRSFLMARVAWGHIDVLTNISGAFGLFQREHVVKVGGFTTGSMGEDFDFTVKLHKYICDSNEGYKIKFVPEATCWTQVPEKNKILANQRTRWQAGAIETFYHFNKLLFSRKYKRTGRLLLPYVILADVLGPLAEILGYTLLPLFFYFDILSLNSFISYTALVFSYNIFVSSVAIVMDGVILPGLDKRKYLFALFLISILENVGYRQLCLWWRIKGTWKFMTGKTIWGKMERVSFDKESN